MSGARGTDQYRGRHLAHGGRTHGWDLRAHEWDFRAGPGSRIGGSFVAMWKSSGRAGGTAGVARWVAGQAGVVFGTGRPDRLHTPVEPHRLHASAEPDPLHAPVEPHRLEASVEPDRLEDLVEVGEGASCPGC